MVKLLQQRAKCGFQFSEVHDPPSGLRCLARDGNAHVERVAVESRAFVALRYVGQPMCCFKMKVFVNIHELTSFPGKRAQYKPVIPPVAGRWAVVCGPFRHTRQVSKIFCCYTFDRARFISIMRVLDRGWLAQLGEHLPYKQRVGGSIPSPPTTFSPPGEDKSRPTVER